MTIKTIGITINLHGDQNLPKKIEVVLRELINGRERVRTIRFEPAHKRAIPGGAKGVSYSAEPNHGSQNPQQK